MSSIFPAGCAGPPVDSLLVPVVDQIRERGYAVSNAIVPASLCTELLACAVRDTQAYERAGVGPLGSQRLNRFVRRDAIRWIDGMHPATRFYLDWAESFRLYMNRRLMLGLFEYECHFARYPVGGFYRTHVDAFRGESNRILSTVLYLNPDWSADDGGDLVIYAEDRTTILKVVTPIFGTFVTFLSEEFPHEVLPALRPRYSLTGWFRVNQSARNPMPAARRAEGK